MVRVLSIVPYKILPPTVGGQKGIALFNEYFSKECELLCVSVESNDPRFAKGYGLIRLLSDSSLRYINPAYFFSIKKLIRQHQITHLLLEHPYFGWLGIMLKWFSGVKLVIHSHNIETTRWKSLGKWWWKVLFWYESAVHQGADYNFFIHDQDRNYALETFKLKASRCITVTYGIDIKEAPPEEEKKRCKRVLRDKHHISDNETIFLFNGALDYGPNYEGLKSILNKINPLLLASGYSYKIIICGRGLPEEQKNLKAYSDKNIIYAGFVDDISTYFKGCDVFINPVVDGGGIKTKLVESLGFNTKCISTINGSVGVSKENTGGQLSLVPDHDWNEFGRQMMETALQPPGKIPDSFYDKFYWGNIARKAAAFLNEDVKD